jgi:hypothetical protein
MTTRISATFAATDGRTPENIEIETDLPLTVEDVKTLVITFGSVAAVGYAAASPDDPRPTVEWVEEDDESYAVHVGDKLVATVNHDEHGWSGIDAVRDTAQRIAEAAGLAYVSR